MPAPRWLKTAIKDLVSVRNERISRLCPMTKQMRQSINPVNQKSKQAIARGVQRCISRQNKNWKKGASTQNNIQRLKVQLLHQKSANLRTDDIKTEDWNVSKMMKSTHLSIAALLKKQCAQNKTQRKRHCHEKRQILKQTSESTGCVNRRSPSEGNRQNVPMA